MKGKSIFTKDEADQIVSLIERKLKAHSSKQVSIRNRIRKLGFYATDFYLPKGYTVEDFKNAVTIKDDIKGNSVDITLKAIPKKVTPNIELTSQEEIFTDDFLKKMGFEGFKTIQFINKDFSILPKVAGVYILLYPKKKPQFLEVGSGGAYKGKNPNVSLEILQENWVSNTSVIYIGKAGGTGSSSTIHSRLKQYFNFGVGRPIGHWGGRFVWQLKDAEDVIVCWKSFSEIEPRTLEKLLIEKFKNIHDLRPFANLVG